MIYIPKYLVTIIISVFNSEKTILRCINSIKYQTSDKWLVILTDDASTDNSWELIRELCENDTRFCLIRNKKNRGLTKNLISMMDLVKTEFIARIDADDYYMPSKIEQQLKFMTLNKEYALCATGFYYESNGKKKTGKKYNEIDITKNFFKQNQIVHGSAMFRIYTGINYRSYFKFSQDYDLWLRLSKRGKLGVIPEPLYILTLSNTSISSNNKKKQYLFAILALSQSRKCNNYNYFSNFKRGWYIFKIAIKSGNVFRVNRLILSKGYNNGRT